MPSAYFTLLDPHYDAYSWASTDHRFERVGTTTLRHVSGRARIILTLEYIDRAGAVRHLLRASGGYFPLTVPTPGSNREGSDFTGSYRHRLD